MKRNALKILLVVFFVELLALFLCSEDWDLLLKFVGALLVLDLLGGDEDDGTVVVYIGDISMEVRLVFPLELLGKILFVDVELLLVLLLLV